MFLTQSVIAWGNILNKNRETSCICLCWRKNIYFASIDVTKEIYILDSLTGVDHLSLWLFCIENQCIASASVISVMMSFKQKVGTPFNILEHTTVEYL